MSQLVIDRLNNSSWKIGLGSGGENPGAIQGFESNGTTLTRQQAFMQLAGTIITVNTVEGRAIKLLAENIIFE